MPRSQMIRYSKWEFRSFRNEEHHRKSCHLPLDERRVKTLPDSTISQRSKILRYAQKLKNSLVAFSVVIFLMAHMRLVALPGSSAMVVEEIFEVSAWCSASGEAIAALRSTLTRRSVQVGVARAAISFTAAGSQMAVARVSRCRRRGILIGAVAGVGCEVSTDGSTSTCLRRRCGIVSSGKISAASVVHDLRDRTRAEVCVAHAVLRSRRKE